MVTKRLLSGISGVWRGLGGEGGGGGDPAAGVTYVAGKCDDCFLGARGGGGGG